MADGLRSFMFVGTLAVAGMVTAAAIYPFRDTSNDWMEETHFEGYTAYATFNERGRFVMIEDKLSPNSQSRSLVYVNAQDRDNDGRFDIINVKVPKGHDLERYASLSELERIYSEIEAQRDK